MAIMRTTLVYAMLCVLLCTFVVEKIRGTSKCTL
jgi:hypothetical protein